VAAIHSGTTIRRVGPGGSNPLAPTKLTDHDHRWRVIRTLLGLRVYELGGSFVVVTDSPEDRMGFDQLLDFAEHAFELAGVGILLIGGLVSVLAYVRDVSNGHRRLAYDHLRQNIGRTILLGLEVLIVADIILTVAIDQTLENAATLGLIVLVRTFLSFSLDIELDGVVPWHRRAADRAPGP
jgi:uncharacterized membrane protein